MAGLGPWTRLFGERERDSMGMAKKEGGGFSKKVPSEESGVRRNKKKDRREDKVVRERYYSSNKGVRTGSPDQHYEARAEWLAPGRLMETKGELGEILKCKM